MSRCIFVENFRADHLLRKHSQLVTFGFAFTKRIESTRASRTALDIIVAVRGR